MPSPATPTDLVDRLFRRLVANLSALDPGAIHRPVRIQEIHERLVPYRTHRALLGFDSNEDYEMTVLRLLAGEHGFVQVFPADVADALAREATAVNPDTGLFKQFPDATAVLNTDTGDSEPEPRVVVIETQDAAPPLAAAPRTPHPEPAEEEEAPLPFALEESEDEEEAKPVAKPREVTASAPCPYCGAGLPVGRTVLFCPHCGQNIGVVHCPTCGSELDVGWGFCITCGQKLSGLG